MEPNKNEKAMCWKDIKTSILNILIILFPIMVIIFSETIAKIMNITSAQVITTSLPIILLIEIIVTSLVLKDSEEYESSTPNKKDYVNCIELEIRGRKHIITTELYNLLGKRGVPTLGEVLSLPPKTKRTSQVPTDIQHFTKDKENNTSRVTPFPTKQETPKRVNEESMQEFIENHIKRMADLDYIAEEIKKHNYPITKELNNILEKGRTSKTLRKDFDDYIRNNQLKLFATETFDLTKNTEAPRVDPIISDIINQIQTHSDNIIVKKQGKQLTIKATLNQNNQNKNNQWGEF